MREAGFGYLYLRLQDAAVIVPEPFTPEAGETWSLEDIDYWIDR